MTDPFPDDDALVAALRAGDARAWNAFVARYERLIFSVPRRMGLDAATSSDVLQDVLLAFLRGLPRLRDARTVPRWLTRTAFRIAAERRRRWRREAPAEDPEVFATLLAEDDVADLAARAEDAARARRALAAMGGRCEELLTLLFLADPPVPYGEIARRLGAPIGSLGPTRQRCLARLLDLLGGPDPSPRITRAVRPTLSAKGPIPQRRTRRPR